MKTQREILGALIKTQRELANLSLRQLADAAEISNAYLSQVERGLHEPSVRVLRGIADALDISMEAFLRQAGMSTGGGEAVSVEKAIAADPRLTQSKKEALLAVYRSLLDDE